MAEWKVSAALNMRLVLLQLKEGELNGQLNAISAAGDCVRESSSAKMHNIVASCSPLYAIMWRRNSYRSGDDLVQLQERSRYMKSLAKPARMPTIAKLSLNANVVAVQTSFTVRLPTAARVNRMRIHESNNIRSVMSMCDTKVTHYIV
jgi:hypothetical protein